MKNLKIVIAGGTGFLGRELINYYRRKGAYIHVLARKPHVAQGRVLYHLWDGESLGPWKRVLENADVLVNLSGKSVDCRYHQRNKRQILESRVHSTLILNEAIKKCVHPPQLWINAGSATIYRDARDRQMDEATGEIGTGFSVSVCRQWEKAFYKESLPGTRKVVLRLGAVMGWEGGALVHFYRLARAGWGGQQGDGAQYMSWLHAQDYCRMIDFFLQQPHLEGTFNATAPYPALNIRFMQQLRKAAGIRWGLPIPVPLLEVGAFLLRTEAELLLKSRNVVPTRLVEAGFHFQFPHLEEALHNLLAQKNVYKGKVPNHWQTVGATGGAQ